MKNFLRQKFFAIARWFFLLPMLASCGTNQKQTELKLFDFDRLLNNQARQLVKVKAVLQKDVQMQNKVEHITVPSLDSQRWMNELEIFQQLSQINKPVNRNSYSITDHDDIQSNLQVRAFHSNEQIPFQDIKIYYLETLSDIRKIEGTVNQQNPIYKSTRALTLNFNEVHNKHMLTSYSIKGGQQIIMGDTVQFNIQGFITIHE